MTTGLYTSPHLVHIEERVRLNGCPIGTSDLVRQVARLDGFSDLTFF
jgi:folylpolyglutamate synthase/dihydropteroate synthase